MESFKSILVDIDATAAVHPALERAIRLARGSGASLTITDVMTVPAYARRHLPPDVEEAMVSRRRQQLASVAQAVTGVRTEARLLVGRPATALIQEVLRSNHDLLMRSHARDTVVSDARGFGAVDMELLRKCPCPVFLVRHGPVGPRRHFVAAVNTSTEDPAERALNLKIVAMTQLLADLDDGVPVLLHAWTPFAERVVRSHVSDDAFTAYVDDSRHRTAKELRELAASFGGRFSEVQKVQRRGEPEAVIPEFAAAHGADLVVMGTVARGGITGLFIGNTAERVLRRLPCSVVAVKPDGFTSPLEADRARWG